MNRAKICIVAVGYNRPDSVKRLLDSLYRAEYGGDNVDLLISIDKGQKQQKIVDVAEAFEWRHGNKTIRAFSERQGLRKHIIQCGDLALMYEAVVVLEDDITVADGFYYYVKQCIKKYGNDNRIAGISLYNHHINAGVGHFFEAEYIGYDTFMMQVAQSWGECWTTNMWSGFKEWYKDNEDKFFKDEQNQYLSMMPSNILRWGEQSWMKYYMGYICEKNLFFVYPYFSLSTNHSEIGQHNNETSCDYQVAMARGNFDYRMPEFDEAVKYDMFFERLDYQVAGYEDKKTILDLYGNKKIFNSADILISSVSRPYKIINSWKLKYRPQELNCKFPEQGNDLFVYNLHESSKSPRVNSHLHRTRYDVRALAWKKLIALGISELITAIKRKIKSKLRL